MRSYDDWPEAYNEMRPIDLLVYIVAIFFKKVKISPQINILYAI